VAFVCVAWPPSAVAFAALFWTKENEEQNMKPKIETQRRSRPRVWIKSINSNYPYSHFSCVSYLEPVRQRRMTLCLKLLLVFLVYFVVENAKQTSPEGFASESGIIGRRRTEMQNKPNSFSVALCGEKNKTKPIFFIFRLKTMITQKIKPKKLSEAKSDIALAMADKPNPTISDIVSKITLEEWCPKRIYCYLYFTD
jgi:hypothetical protein